MGEVILGYDSEGKHVTLTYNDEYSFKDYTGHLFTRPIPPGTVVYASCFSQEILDHEIFPSDMTDVTFVRCNLDNVALPPGNTVESCSQRRFEVQNDLRDWEVDSNDAPAKLVDEKYWDVQGYSTDPADIPPEKIDHIDKVPKKTEKDTVDVAEVGI